MAVEIRSAKREDCKDIYNLIKELAAYTGFNDRPRIDVATFLQDGFGDSPYFHCFVAEITRDAGNEKTKLIVGYCLYFYSYSTWEGKSVHMEDLYLKPAYRKRGIGLKLWQRLAKEAVDKKCKRLDFVVLNSNQSSIAFYEKVGAKNQTKREGWNLFRLTEDALGRFANVKSELKEINHC